MVMGKREHYQWLVLDVEEGQSLILFYSFNIRASSNGFSPCSPTSALVYKQIYSHKQSTTQILTIKLQISEEKKEIKLYQLDIVLYFLNKTLEL